MQAYPLFFKIAQEVQAPGFRASVSGTGRVLMESLDEAWWCRGVDAAGIVGRGADPVSAFQSFRLTLGDVLEEISEDAPSFEDFRTTVRGLFSKVSKEENRWTEALASIRADRIIPSPPFDELPRWDASLQEIGLSVKQVRGFSQAEDRIALAANADMAA